MSQLESDLFMALRELVACHDLKREESRLRQRRECSIKRNREAIAMVDDMRDEYNRRIPAAVDAARAAIAKATQKGKA